MEWINTFIGICIIILFFIDKFFWSKNRFDSMKAQIDSLKTENITLNNTLTAHINLLKDQRYDPSHAAAQIQIMKDRIDQLGKEKDENSEQIKSYIIETEKLTLDNKKLGDEKIKLVTSATRIVEQMAREEQATRAAYEKQISELKLKDASSSGLAAFFKDQEDNKKDN